MTGKRWNFEFRWWPINRPRISLLWIAENEYTLTISWGNGNSDPVWNLDLTFSVPDSVDRWLERRGLG